MIDALAHDIAVMAGLSDGGRTSTAAGTISASSGLWICGGTIPRFAEFASCLLASSRAVLAWFLSVAFESGKPLLAPS